MQITLLQLATAFIYGAAGFSVCLMLLNRFLILLPDNMGKMPFILTAFTCFTGGGTLLGLFFHRPAWIFLPIMVLCFIVLGEARRVFIRRLCAGTKPVNTTPHQINIRKPVTTTDITVHQYKISHPKWTGPRFRIVHLTDLHIHPNLPLEYYKQVISVAEKTAPDIAVFTGDFVDKLEALPALREVLRPIAKNGSYAVLGNHDYWAGADPIRTVIKESGLHLISDESIVLPVLDSEIVITGYDYPWGTKKKSIPHQKSDRLHLVLSHTPDNIYRIADSSADFVFSGHYHAGQIRAPILGPIIIPSVYGRRFDHGHFLVNNTHLFVASGIGAANPPIRIFCQPDIFIVDIVSEARER